MTSTTPTRGASWHAATLLSDGTSISAVAGASASFCVLGDVTAVRKTSTMPNARANGWQSTSVAAKDAIESVRARPLAVLRRRRQGHLRDRRKPLIAPPERTPASFRFLEPAPFRFLLTQVDACPGSSGLPERCPSARPTPASGKTSGPRNEELVARLGKMTTSSKCSGARWVFHPPGGPGIKTAQPRSATTGVDAHSGIRLQAAADRRASCQSRTSCERAERRAGEARLTVR